MGVCDMNINIICMNISKCICMRVNTYILYKRIRIHVTTNRFAEKEVLSKAGSDIRKTWMNTNKSIVKEKPLEVDETVQKYIHHRGWLRKR